MDGVRHLAEWEHVDEYVQFEEDPKREGNVAHEVIEPS
jgi:hypothetical protein